MIKRLFVLLFLFAITTDLALGGISTLNESEPTVRITSRVPNIQGEMDAKTRPEEPFIFASLPTFDENIKTSIKTADARPELIRQYLKSYESPLEPHADLIVQLSDQYNFDYRWLPAIAMQESNLCKRIPDNSYNCWGWGIYPDPKDPTVLKVTRFDSYEDALRRIAPQFTKIFLKGNHSKDPMEVMKTYTPPSDGSWAFGINQFFGKME